ncbi:hypothetical protein FRACYDRAFT_238279 [Fragilariopsis cylindrus CCMP1102]|uniref:F-box domain-containing protein n=1 Tax=Fragilariopsis cylindrus CCMP1102 TaxID=635003 RepID=A0A1E7FI53_9STRA|nr:hypothetical protein FRACYDRAFT_238279 [Fragilariopsis cylindrus CCMP1102]|eukprot:OEU17851.1 hypothetical protein FRACYDRAFT_238279 [Fragilariopsis cylindrus CCMP1102]
MSISSNEEEEHEEYETESEDEDEDEDETDDDKEQEMGTTTTASYNLLPDSIRVKILNYLGGDQCTLDELIDLTVVSKQFYNDLKRQKGGIEWKIIPTYIISPRPKSNTRSLLRKLVYNQKENQSKKFNHYKRIKLNCINEYNDVSSWDAQQIHLTNTYYDIDTPKRRNRGNKLLFDISLPPTSLDKIYKRQVRPSVIFNIISCLFHRILTQLNTLQVTNIIWNYSKYNIDISGYQFHLIQDTIKEFIMNDTIFLIKNRQEYNDFVDLIDEPNENYIFQDFCENGTKLERLSIKNAKVFSSRCSSFSQCIDVPQNALMKFIRNAPKTLKWFHSDLTQGNIDVLKKERPDIEFM